jgi:hypothetical protein
VVFHESQDSSGKGWAEIVGIRLRKSPPVMTVERALSNTAHVLLAVGLHEKLIGSALKDYGSQIFLQDDFFFPAITI